MLFFLLHQMWDVLVVTFPDTSPVRCPRKPPGSSTALRHRVWPVHLCHSPLCRWIRWVESRIAEQWTMLSFVVSRQTSGQKLSQKGKYSLFKWTIHGLTMGGFSGGGQTRSLEMMVTSQVLGHWCKVMLFLKDDVGRLLDTDTSAPL